MKSSPVVAIICAKDEGSRIESVLRAALPVLPVLVVDDGSTDDTAAVARSLGARVLSLPKNGGKGAAMLAGLQATREPVILFLDADLKGVTKAHIDALVLPVLSGECEMMVGTNDYGPRFREVVGNLPLISGQRAVRRDMIAKMPIAGFSGYKIETFMNHAIAAQGGRIATVPLVGLTYAPKWEKDGLAQGVAKMVDMAAEVVKAHEEAALSMSVGAPSSPSDYAGMTVAPTPPSLAARGASTEDVMNALAEAIVRAGRPLVAEHFDDRTKEMVADKLAKRLSAPAWTLAVVATTVVAGPVAGLMTTITALFHTNG